ncbi:hypothetical protein, partial [Pseudomonas syringae group genomosp. 3]|uniref:hypothetical protein n=1 Tax=Pseudomonas syringae group genomosp. 3 TaxID=251701 RepID=UPI001C3F341C
PIEVHLSRRQAAHWHRVRRRGVYLYALNLTGRMLNVRFCPFSLSIPRIMASDSIPVIPYAD